jgi:hypothetical protein
MSIGGTIRRHRSLRRSRRWPDFRPRRTANADYAWADDLIKNHKAPYAQELRFRSIRDQSTRSATLESGESLTDR